MREGLQIALVARRCLLGGGLLLLAYAAALGAGQVPPTPPAQPVDPITAIVRAFESHNLVALSEPHGNEQAHAFRIALVSDRRFASTVNDIVWECGNARYQDVMDRFIRGDDVPATDLRPVWQNTVGSVGTVCDLPIYEEFLRAVRVANAALPQTRRVRVLLGDPPIDWAAVKTIEDAVKWAEMRESHAAELIQREVLLKGRRALIIYGSAHLMRQNIRPNYERDDRGWLVTRLGDSPEARIFSIWSDTTVDLTAMQSDVTSWKAPSLAMLRGTVLGARDFADYWAVAGGIAGITARFVIRDGKRVDVPKTEWRVRRMDEQYDAVLYYGPKSAMTESRLSPALCADPAYMEMRLGRMTLVGQPTDQLRIYCASVTK